MKKRGTLGLPATYASPPLEAGTKGAVTVRPWDLEALWHRRATPGLQPGPGGSGPAGSLLLQAGVWLASQGAHQLSPDTAMRYPHLSRSRAASSGRATS